MTSQIFSKRINYLGQNCPAQLLSSGKKGIEKESLRVTPEGTLAQTTHPSALGSTLTHPDITTDYSEALLELITPPFEDSTEALQYLHDIHRFVYANIGDEMLWATSMPCIVDGDKSIPIAEYGSSNVGIMKHIYRRGLDVRYGRLMQAISGIHFNYSVPAELWPLLQEYEQDTRPQRAFIDERYMGIARNAMRLEWLLTYLFGNSPAFCKTFLGGSHEPFQELSAHTGYEPYGTSLRMSDIGYKNNSVSGLSVPYDNLESYIAGLDHAVNTPYPPYEALGVIVDGEYQQLNGNILQIANEYYSSVRPKQPTQGNEQPTHALQQRGVQYIEVRVLDVDAFEPAGVGQSQLHFLEMCLLYCLLQDSPTITSQEQAEIDHNQKMASQYGRDPKLQLRRNGDEISLSTWAIEILEEMSSLAELLDRSRQEAEFSNPYSHSLAQQVAAIREPERTPSARMLAEMVQRDESFFRFAMRKSLEHQQLFTSQSLTGEKLDHFQKAATRSLEKQHTIEASDDRSFDAYLAQYFGVGDEPSSD